MDGTYIINEEQAETVRRIYDLYLSGKGYVKIAHALEHEHRKTVNGETKWNSKTVQGVLTNEKYYGAIISQKTVVVDFMKHKRAVNNGTVRQILNDNHHPSIISKPLFDRAQDERNHRAAVACGINPDHTKFTVRYALSEHLFCEHCGAPLRRKWRTNGIVWQCNHKLHGNIICSAPGIHNTVVEQSFIQLYNQIAADYQSFFDEFLHMVVNRTKRQEQKSDVALLDKQVKSLQSQIDELIMMKARREIDGDFYNRNYQTLKEELFALQEKRAACADRQLIATNQKARMERIKEAFSTRKAPLREYDEDLFAALIEKAVVHSPTDITFMLYGGMEYRVDGAKYKPKDGRGRPRKDKQA